MNHQIKSFLVPIMDIFRRGRSPLPPPDDTSSQAASVTVASSTPSSSLSLPPSEATGARPRSKTMSSISESSYDKYNIEQIKSSVAFQAKPFLVSLCVKKHLWPSECPQTSNTMSRLGRSRMEPSLECRINI